MFRLMKLSPPHGWRAVLWELAIVTLGVLLALVAQQSVESLQLRSKQRALRQTIDHEIGLNLFVYKIRARQFACVDKRLADLKVWLARARSGQDVDGLSPAGPTGLTPYRSAWDNRDAEVFNSLPNPMRQKYSEFYDELSANWNVMQDEDDAWSRLVPYAEGGPITLSDRRNLRSILAAAANGNAMLKTNVPISLKIAQVLEVEEVKPDNLPADWLSYLGECRSVVPSQRSQLR